MTTCWAFPYSKSYVRVVLVLVVTWENKVNSYSDQLKLAQVCKFVVEFDKKEKKIMTFLVATNVVASRPPERRPTGAPTAHAKSCFPRIPYYQTTYIFTKDTVYVLTIGKSSRRCSWLPFRRSTGNDVSGQYFHHYFLLLFPFFSPSSPFLIEGVLGSKNLFSES